MASEATPESEFRKIADGGASREDPLEVWRCGGGTAMVQELARARGPLGEVVLRRRRGLLEVIGNGTFLISEENEHSSRALVSAARHLLPRRPLDVLIGGLGLGYAVEEALRLPHVRSVVVAELEPAVVDWFRTFSSERAARVECDRRLRIVVGDVLDQLRAGARAWDLICLDTDNGPGWLVHQANAALYEVPGIRTVRAALREGGVAVFWSAERYPAFEASLAAVFRSVLPRSASDVVDGRRHEYTMYVVR